MLVRTITALLIIKEVPQMKKIFGLYVSTYRPATLGINDTEYNKIRRAIDEEYDAAKARQKNPDGQPSQYMRGLAFAKAALETIKPHAMEAV